MKRTIAGVIGGVVGLVALSAVAGLLISAAVTPAVAMASAAATSAIDTFDSLPSELQINPLQLPTTLYAKNPTTGKYQELTEFYDQNRVPVKWNQVAPVMYDAILSSEDPRFYDEGGIDIMGTTRAILSNLRGGGATQGGSSISQQYVKNVLVQDCYAQVDDQNLTQKKRDAALQKCYNDATDASGPDGYARKLQEMRYAIALAQQYSKNDVLLAYLNIANFGGVTYGIEAASEYYFGVHASKLSLSQAATLAGMVQNPNTYRIDQSASKTNGKANHYAETKQRQEYVLGRMLDGGKISQAQYQEAMKAPIVPKITPPKTGCAATTVQYFCAYVTSIIQNDPAFGATPADREQTLRQGGLKVYTTLDWRLQKVAQSTVSKYAPASRSAFGYGSTIVNVQPSTGDIMSIAQNTHYSAGGSSTTSAQTGIVYAGNYLQGSTGFAAGSSFKLFTLLDWLQEGHSVNEVINGYPRVIHHLSNSCQANWTNYDNTFIPNYKNERGYYGTPMQFTAQSLNSGYLAMATKLDLCGVMQDATKLGVTLANGTGPVEMTTGSSVIGSNAVSPIAMAGAYAGIANNGLFCQPRAIARVTDNAGKDLPLPKRTCTQAIDPKIAATAAYALQGVLKGPMGTAVMANPHDGTPLFAKTGTNNGDQTWLITSSTAMTSLVWSGVTNNRGDENIDLFHHWYRGFDLGDIRYPMSKAIQTAADIYYPGSALPQPDPKLTVRTGSYPAPPRHDTSAKDGKGKTPSPAPTPGTSVAPAPAPTVPTKPKSHRHG
ncbi:transglycosylase domain-containing protein [Microbacterium terrisoli]|uniref:transglycosylase domain-containing protein n=1 Tax=Microbacterium terrisoli TaxID=3242192 RepID=UPI002805B296|nr:transglycosylase domain-containing protein [Microbacterium protaetiae]